MRLAALARFGWDGSGSQRRPKAPPEISGRGPDGKPLPDPRHSHTFWLPEDADADGWIDHISLYCRSGFGRGVRARLDGLTRLWLQKKNGTETGARREWRLAIEGFGQPRHWRGASRLFARSRVWVSVTPFLAAGHLKKGVGYPGEVRRLLRRRRLLSDDLAARVQVQEIDTISVSGSPRRAAHFHRFRSRGRERQPDRHGALLRLTFPAPITGPLALGFGSHFGLGLFRAGAEHQARPAGSQHRVGPE